MGGGGGLGESGGEEGGRYEGGPTRMTKKGLTPRMYFLLQFQKRGPKAVRSNWGGGGRGEGGGGGDGGRENCAINFTEDSHTPRQQFKLQNIFNNKLAHSCHRYKIKCYK